MEEKRFETNFGGQSLVIETGLAPQANAAIKLTYGETVVLVTAVLSGNAREGVNYLPLMVEYEEKMYAAGRIKGSRFMKREGRPTEEAVLTGRVIDRILRPRFDKRIRNSIQVVVTVLSFDGINDPDILGVIGASLALSISDIPWDGPLAAVRVAKVDDKFIINPSYEEREKCLLDLMVASDGEVVNMIELGSGGTDNKDIMGAIKEGVKSIKENINFQNEVIKEFSVNKKTLDLVELNKETEEKANDYLTKTLALLFDDKDKIEFKEILTKTKKGFDELFAKEIKASEAPGKLTDGLMMYFEKEIDALVHKNILEHDQRPDGRKLDEVRALNGEVGLLPRVHGSGLFKRGLTHVLSSVTLGSPREEQLLDGMEMVGTKGFMHHYNFPPYSVGETGFFRGPGRREIGHGALAEKALLPIIPEKEDFPYTIRLVSEVLSSNGSSSMASACASTLALMDAGVPIKAPVAGIAMGLMLDEKDHSKYKIITDIQGPEDHYGDMDLKISGTMNKVTAMQMDVKIGGISEKILTEALEQAHKARIEILDVIQKTIKEPNKELSQYAPKIVTIKIDKSKIGEVIGSGGKTINAIIEKTGAGIEIKDDGQVFVSGQELKGVNEAVEIIKNMTREYEPGEVFEGKVTRILDFGAFVAISPVQEGLVHISKMALYHVASVRDIVLEGDKVKVEVIKTDEMGRIDLKLIKNFDREPKKNDPAQPRDPFSGPRERNNRGGNGSGNRNFNRR